MSIARWNLKEAAGKALARRTGIAYEAVVLGEMANIIKARTLSGKYGRICGGHKRKGRCALPGEICKSAARLLGSGDFGKDSQKSAEAIVGDSTSPKG